MAFRHRWLVLLTLLALVASACAAADTTPSVAPAEPEDEPALLPFVEEETLSAESYQDAPVEYLDEVAGLDPVLFDDPASGTKRGVTDEVIRVGGIVAKTINDALPLYANACDGAEARIARANQAGELSRLIWMVGCKDDSADIATNAVVVGQHLDDDVFAIVPLLTPAGLSTDLWTNERMPVFGYGELPVFCGYDNPLGFAVGGTESCGILDGRELASGGVPTLALIQDAGDLELEGLRVAVVTDDSAAGVRDADALAFAVEAGGGTVVARFDRSFVEPLGRTEALSLATELSDGDADLVVVLAEEAAELIVALDDQNFRGIVAASTHIDPASIDPTVLDTAFSGVLQVVPGLDLASQAGDGWQQILADAFISGFPSGEIDAAFVRGYASADFFIAAVAATPEPLTAEALANTINSGFTYDGVDGVVCPSEWPLGHVAGAPCGSVAQIDFLGESPLEPLVPLTSYELGLREGS